MEPRTKRALKLYLILATSVILALSSITLCYQIATGNDTITGLPTWVNMIVTCMLFALSVTFTRSIDDEHTTNNDKQG